MFGQTQQPGQTGGLFGQPAQPAQQQSTGLFGASSPAQNNAFGKSSPSWGLDHPPKHHHNHRRRAHTLYVDSAPDQARPEERSEALPRAPLGSNSKPGLHSELLEVQEEVYSEVPPEVSSLVTHVPVLRGLR